MNSLVCYGDSDDDDGSIEDNSSNSVNLKEQTKTQVPIESTNENKQNGLFKSMNINKLQFFFKCLTKLC